MATAQFGKDRNWEGYIRVVYNVTSDPDNNCSYVTITDVQFQSIEGRSARWSIYGVIRFRWNNRQYPFSYQYIGFNTYGTGWVSIEEYGWDDYSFTVNHDENGNGSFSVHLENLGNYNDFNIFHPNGGSYNCEYNDGTSITINLPKIDRSGATVTLSVSTGTNGSVTLSATSDVACSGWEYSANSDGHWYMFKAGSGTSASVTIPGPFIGSNSFRVLAIKDSNGVYSYSNTVYTEYPSVSFGANSVTTDSRISMNATSMPSGGYTIKIKYLNTELKSLTYPAGATAIQTTFLTADLKAMFVASGNTTSKSITVTASVEGYSAATASFTLTAGNNMIPSVGSPILSIVQTGKAATYFPDTYIAGISKVKIESVVESGSNATIQTVKASYGSNTVNMTYNSTTQKYEATTPAPITGNVMFSVTATDTRGMVTISQTNLNTVHSYTLPSFTIDTGMTYRCDSNGDQADGGGYVRARATATFDTSLSGNQLTLYFYVQEDGSNYKHYLTSGTQSPAYQMINPGPNNMVTLTFVAEDLVGEPVTRWIKLTAAHKDVVVMRDGGCTGVGIGIAPEKRTYYDRYELQTVPLPGSIDLPEMGGLFIGGVNAANFGPGVDIVEGNDSPILQHDALNIDERKPRSLKNQAIEIRHGTGSTYGQWTHLPSAVSGLSEFNAVRFVIFAKLYVMVVMIEFTPTAGRIWFNSKWKDVNETATYNWRGWKGITPDIT